MDELLTAIHILEAYDEISCIQQSENKLKYITFSIRKHDFLMLCPEESVPSSRVTIFAVNDTCDAYPHIMTEGFDIGKDKSFPEGNYKALCLYESGSVIMSLFTFEEKIVDAIERLLELVNLSKLQIEKELQKEFLYYWDDVAEEGKIDIYLGDDSKAKKLNVYLGKDEMRCVAHGISLNDKEKKDGDNCYWKHRADICAYYIPLIDNRGIIPPTKKTGWGKNDILNVLYGKQISHISRESFEFISSEQIKARSMILSFGMLINDVRKVFTMVVSFNNATKNSVIAKIQNDITEVRIIKSKRQDYYALSKAIGNRIDLMDKKVLIVGAGSLGSYVAAEMVKNGFRSITVYDGDQLEPDNMMRWAYGGFGQGLEKPYSLRLFLEYLHPEIHIRAIGKDLDKDALLSEINSQDIIIFTIGNSDKQLYFNNLLKSNNCSIPVIYSWIEAGGNYSHLLKVEYNTKGCFQCLYTDEKGALINNKANRLEEDAHNRLIIRNGCGGTRAPYGTAVLLRTVAAMLYCIENIFDVDDDDNYLLTVTKEEGYQKNYKFYEGMCNCCGNHSTE